MTLLEDIQTALDNDFSADDIESALPDVTMVEDQYQNSSRWSEQWRAVYKRETATLKLEGDELEHVVRVTEYVAVDYQRPSTELQEVTDPYDDVYVVTPREVTRIEYVVEA